MFWPLNIYFGLLNHSPISFFLCWALHLEGKDLTTPTNQLVWWVLGEQILSHCYTSCDNTITYLHYCLGQPPPPPLPCRVYQHIIYTTTLTTLQCVDKMKWTRNAMRVARLFPININLSIVNPEGTGLADQMSWALYYCHLIICIDVFRVRSKEYKKRALQNVPLVLAPGVDIGISVWVWSLFNS